jgi:hypothetical protein
LRRGRSLSDVVILKNRIDHGGGPCPHHATAFVRVRACYGIARTATKRDRVSAVTGCRPPSARGSLRLPCAPAGGVWRLWLPRRNWRPPQRRNSVVGGNSPQNCTVGRLVDRDTNALACRSAGSLLRDQLAPSWAAAATAPGRLE